MIVQINESGVASCNILNVQINEYLEWVLAKMFYFTMCLCTLASCNVIIFKLMNTKKVVLLVGVFFYYVHTWFSLSFLELSIGLNRTSRPVPVVREFSNVRIPDFRFFSLPDSGLIRVLEMEKSLWFDFLPFWNSLFVSCFLMASQQQSMVSYQMMPAALRFSLLFLKSNCQVGGRGRGKV